jgi:hypothetical protein
MRPHGPPQTITRPGVQRRHQRPRQGRRSDRAPRPPPPESAAPPRRTGPPRRMVHATVFDRGNAVHAADIRRRAAGPAAGLADQQPGRRQCWISTKGGRAGRSRAGGRPVSPPRQECQAPAPGRSSAREERGACRVSRSRYSRPSVSGGRRARCARGVVGRDRIGQELAPLRGTGRSRSSGGLGSMSRGGVATSP